MMYISLIKSKQKLFVFIKKIYMEVQAEFEQN